MNSSGALRSRNLSVVFALVGLLALVWGYAGTIAVLARKWEADPQYSHGYLVPLFSLALLWLRRDALHVDRLRPSLWGVPLLVAALLLRHAATILYMEWFEQLSLVLCVPAIVLLVGGGAALRWAWPACLFLVFMVPLPFSLEVALRDPLRRIGTIASTYVMQTVGLPAYAQGKVIIVDDVHIGVAEACSGLRMLMIFFALATAVAMIGDRPLWQRGLVVLSAIPIALIANIARITATGSLHAVGYEQFAEMVFHDLAGWLMMPLALILLWLETAFLDRLIIVESDEPVRLAPVGAFASNGNGDPYVLGDASRAARSSKNESRSGDRREPRATALSVPSDGSRTQAGDPPAV
ncbi:MAG: exosortase/archaeosortase family protein [Planctomycetaceae bacterium]